MADLFSCSEVWGGADGVDTSFAVPGMDGALFSRPANGKSGGDVYLISHCNQGLVSKVVLADLAGHGAEVSRVGQTLAELLRANVGERTNDSFLDQLNRQFEAEDARQVVFATLACTTYFPRNRQFCFAYAGHPQIILGRKGVFQSLAIEPGRLDRLANVPIGIDREANFHEGCLRLEPGDWLLLFTDGLIEARNADGQEYGLARMLADVRRLSLVSPMTVKNGLLTRLRDFIAPRVLDQDDMTLVVLRVCDVPDPPVVTMDPRLKALLDKNR